MNMPFTLRSAIKKIAAYAVLACACLLFSAILSGCKGDAPQFASIDITGADYAHEFHLRDHNGQERSLKDFAGKVVVLFFGYTQCPDVCPTTLSELAEVKRLLGPQGAQLQALFVTLDPQRDTPELLKAYMANFDPAFVALRPSPEQLPALAKDFHIYYKQVPGSSPTSYTLDHTAASYVYDPQGRLRLYTRYGRGAAALAGDIRLLLSAKP